MVFKPGDLVDVKPEHRTGRKDSDGGRAFIQSVRSNDNQRGTYDVKYIIGSGNGLSQGVAEDRISHALMDNVARKRRGDAMGRPSLLSLLHVPIPSFATTPSTSAPRPSRKINTSKLLEMAKQSLPPLRKNKGLDALKRFNNKRTAGWLRIEEGLNKTKQLSSAEKELVMPLYFALRSVDDSAGEMVAFAWGVT